MDFSSSLHSLLSEENDSSEMGPKNPDRKLSSYSIVSLSGNTCKICHGGAKKDDELISPCYCSGSLLYVHQGCVQKWIKATDAKSCELCQYEYKVKSTLKSFVKWKPIRLEESERRNLLCSVGFHMIAVTCIIWSLVVLIDRTIKEVKHGNLNWPFWTKVIVIFIGFVAGVAFTSLQF